MIRLIHLLAISALIGSAAYAYRIKYETLYYAETLAKAKAKLQREREAVAVAKAEWALLTRPDRLQNMVDRHLDLQPMTIAQLGRLSDLPSRPPKSDVIGAKLELLGLDPVVTGSTSGKRPGKQSPLGAKIESLGAGPVASPKPSPSASPKPR